jgi:nickel-dependent lactate racemase
VERRGQQLAAEAWLFEAPRRASLVVATIAGGPQHQSWRELGRALFAARQAAEDQAVIVLCTELKSPPGPAMRRLVDESNPDKTRRRIEQDCTPDAIPAHVFAEARKYAKIFLLSELQSDVVEDLGLGYVAHAGEVQRLCRGHESYIFLQDAHRAVVQAPGTWNMSTAASRPLNNSS